MLATDSICMFRHYRKYSTIIFLHLLFAMPVSGHFEVGATYRYFIVTETPSTTEIYVRTPVALVLGDILDGAPDPHGFLINKGSNVSLDYYLSIANVLVARKEFTARLTNSLEWKVGSQIMTGRIRAYRILAQEPEIQLATSSAARASLEKRPISIDVPVGTGYIDMLVSVPKPYENALLSVKSQLPEMVLPDGVFIQNNVVDERNPQNRYKYTRKGQLSRSLAFSRSWSGRMSEYVYQGVLHIYIGIDHILLVLAIVFSATTFWKLLGSITAFTIGHAISLISNFFGLVPQASWFIPFIEVAIAATLIVAAISGFMHRQTSTLMFVLIGCLHGLGFSFVLNQILLPDSTELTLALSSFMVGIEIGQISIVLAALFLFLPIRSAMPRIYRRIKNATLISIGCVGAVFIIQRLPLLIPA